MAEVFNLQGRVSLDSSGLMQGLKKGEQGMKAFGAQMSNSLDKFKSAAKWLVGGYAAKQITSFVKSALDMRGSLEQSLGGVEAVFGDFWVFVNQEAKNAYETLGLSQNQYLETANKIGSLMQGSGFSAQEAAETSIKVMQRASDVASIMGIDVMDAMTAISGAAKGNFTMMDNLGVAMNATSLEAYALEKGITKSYNAMTQAEKIGLAYDMFLEKTAKYAGNYAKENDTYAGSINTLSAAWKNFMTGEGTADAVVESAMRAGKVIYKNLKILVPALARGFGDMIKTSIKKIKWPTWADVKKFAVDSWNAIVKGVANLGGLIFGKNKDGTVKWPTWDDVKTAAENVWEAIKNGVAEFGGLIFGRDSDGNVQWPDIEEIVKSFNEWWQNTTLPALQKAMVWTLTLFGVPNETAEEITTLIGNWWKDKVKFAEDVLHWALHLPSTPYEAGQELGKIIGEWWKGVKEFAEGVLKWTIGLFGISDENGNGTVSMLGAWWEKSVKPLLKDVINFTLGLFDLPDADAMKKRILDWWEKVKKAVGDLVISIGAQIFGIGAEPIDVSGASEYLESHPEQNWAPSYMQGTPHSAGLYEVPYNDYPALLHEGEMVLTRTQADRYRKGEGQGGNSSAVVHAVQRLENTLANLRLVVNGKAFGRASVDYGGVRMSDYIGKADSRLAAGYGS